MSKKLSHAVTNPVEIDWRRTKSKGSSIEEFGKLEVPLSHKNSNVVVTKSNVHRASIDIVDFMVKPKTKATATKHKDQKKSTPRKLRKATNQALGSWFNSIS
ncbi:hypothetical protein SNEBB_007797 [Seison nebaliae]|nr:hypothetical protein SNEBB_007797 [Seison nebaliae]